MVLRWGRIVEFGEIMPKEKKKCERYSIQIPLKVFARSKNEANFRAFHLYILPASHSRKYNIVNKLAKKQPLQCKQATFTLLSPNPNHTKPPLQTPEYPTQICTRKKTQLHT